MTARRIRSLLPLVALLLGACSTEPPLIVAVAGRPSVVDPVLRSFAPEITSRIETVPAAEAEEFDVLWDSDARRAIELKRAQRLAALPAELLALCPDDTCDRDGTWRAVTADVRVIAYDPRRIGDDDAPTHVGELVDPRWRSLLVMGDPESGSSAWHAAALRAAGKTDTVTELAAAPGVTVLRGEREVIKALGDGAHPLALVDGERAFAARENGHRIGILIPDQDRDGAILRASVIALSKRGAGNADARKLVAYLLSPSVGRRLALVTHQIAVLPDGAAAGGSLRLADIRALPVSQSSIVEELVTRGSSAPVVTPATVEGVQP